MPFMYCRTCGHGLNDPSFAESIEGFIECCCGVANELDPDISKEALIRLEERVEALENLTQPTR